MKPTTLIALFISLALLIGCGGAGSLNTTVHAGAPAIPDVGPDVLSCGPAGGGGDACVFVQHVKDETGKELFYCQGETHVYPLTKTMSFHLEIGVSSLIANPNLSGCKVPMPERTGVLNLRGNLALTPWTGNNTSIATQVWAMDGNNKAILYPGKIAATKGIAVAIPMEGTSGQPLVFAQTHYADNFLVWFNIDLPDSVPATISVSGAGEIE